MAGTCHGPRSRTSALPPAARDTLNVGISGDEAEEVAKLAEGWRPPLRRSPTELIASKGKA
jgi:hypothetical protein